MNFTVKPIKGSDKPLFWAVGDNGYVVTYLDERGRRRLTQSDTADGVRALMAQHVPDAKETK